MIVLDEAPVTGCKCAFCQRCQRIEEVVQSRDIDKLIAELNAMANHLVNVEEDLCYYRCVVDGSWDSADAVIAHHRARREGNSHDRNPI